MNRLKDIIKKQKEKQDKNAKSKNIEAIVNAGRSYTSRSKKKGQ